MSEAASAMKVTIYLNDDTGAEKAFLHEELLLLLQSRGIQGATVIRPYAGFGSHGKVHVAGAGSVEGEHLPILISFVDKEEKVKAIMPDLLAAVTDGFVEAHPTRILKVAEGPAGVIA